jgi:hypothetical protein
MQLSHLRNNVAVLAIEVDRQLSFLVHLLALTASAVAFVLVMRPIDP